MDELMFEKTNSSFHSPVSWVFFAIESNSSSSRRMVAERLSENDSVLVVERFISGLRKPTSFRLGERTNTKEGSFTSYSYFHTPERIPFVRPLLTFFNRQRLVNEVEELLGHPPTVVCYDSPSQFHLVGSFGEKISVYVAVDDRTVTVTGHPIKGELEAEKKLLSKVDLVVCVSEPLADAIRDRIPNKRGVPIHVLPNGYDARVFDPNMLWPEPEDLKPLSRPRLLVTGHISDRIDWEGIRDAFHMRPQWTWIFVGPTDSRIQEKIFHALGSQGFWHPSVPIQEVPAWIQHCDVCAVPYQLNSFTLASSPLKAIEYLAMGSPVLSTRIPALLPYGDAIHWIDEGCGESYAVGLDKALAEKTDLVRIKARCTAVRNDSWTKKTESFKAMVLNA
jgi:glycosyltransferase involved in cell wall biosynthesis